MDKEILVYSHQMNGDLDDDYTLYSDGEVLHEYDRNKYPGNFNLTETLKAHELRHEVKQRLLNRASEDLKSKVSKLLGLD